MLRMAVSNLTWACGESSALARSLVAIAILERDRGKATGKIKFAGQ
jgi:hypothetical protein